jgi:hypothetical protein
MDCRHWVQAGDGMKPGPVLIDRNNLEHVDLVAKVIADREFDCAEGRWERTMKRAIDGGGYSVATINRLRVTAQDVIMTINRQLAVPQEKERA